MLEIWDETLLSILVFGDSEDPKAIIPGRFKENQYGHDHTIIVIMADVSLKEHKYQTAYTKYVM